MPQFTFNRVQAVKYKTLRNEIGSHIVWVAIKDRFISYLYTMHFIYLLICYK